MASQLKVDTITGVTTAGSVAVTGEGNSTTTNLQQGLSKMYANFEMDGTQAITKSFNSASITDNGTGDTTISMTNSMGDANYIQIGNTVHDGGTYVVFNSFDHDSPSTSSNVIMNCNNNASGAMTDGEHQMVLVQGDLA
jgi:hypothetical protein